MPLPQVVQKAIARGWSVIPVDSSLKPVIQKWDQFKTKPAPLRQVEEWHESANAQAWGVVTGAASKLVVLIFYGAEGAATLQALGLLPHVQTPQDWFHVYFEHPGAPVKPPDAKGAKALAEKWPGMEIAREGSLVIFNGKLDKKPFRWRRKANLEPLERLPQPLREALNLEQSASARAAGQAADPPPTLDLAGRLLDHALAIARTDGKAQAGVWYANLLRGRGVPEQLARGLMERFAEASGNLTGNSSLGPYSAQEAIAALSQAYSPTADLQISKPESKPKKAEKAEKKATEQGPKIERPEDRWPTFNGKEYLNDEKYGLFYFRSTKEGPIRSRLTNFTAAITADVIKDQGERTSSALKIDGKLNGRPFSAVVSRSEFESMSWPIEHLGAEAIVYPNLRERARTAIQELSPNMAIQHIYQHTGWTKVEDKYFFIHAAGAIGADGPTDRLAIELPKQISRYRLPAPPRRAELVRSIRASLKILGVCPERLTLPLFSAIWRPVLGEVDVALYLSGQSGNGKSELAALAQQHYGAEMSRRHLPANWDSSANALQGITYFAKNTVITIDDFVPRGSAGDIARQHKEADRLIRAAGNLQGRETLTADRQLRGSYYPRGLVLSTGEDIPKGPSCRARMVVCETEPSDMNWELLTECQAEAAAGLYAQTMAAFIEWIAPRLDRMPARILEQLGAFREQWANRDHHSRTPDNLANLSCGLDVFLEFAREAKAITERQAGQLWERALLAYDEAAKAQNRTQEHGEPTKQYLSLVSTALSSGKAHLVMRDGTRPDKEAMCGWVKVNGDWRAQGPKIGWIDDKLLLLDPKASFAVVQNIGREISDEIPVTLQTLGRRLKQRGILREFEEGRETTTARRYVEGRRVPVWVISWEAL